MFTSLSVGSTVEVQKNIINSNPNLVKQKWYNPNPSK